MALSRTEKPVIGFINSASQRGMEAQVQAFQLGLSLGGYVDGQNVAVEYRWGDSNNDQLADHAADLASRNLVLIAATGGAQTAHAVRKATKKTPLLFIAGGPVGQKRIVPKLKGRNATGVNLQQTPSAAHRMRLLNQLVPKPARIISLVHSNRGGKLEADIVRKSGKGKQEVRIFEAASVDVLRTIAELSKQPNSALIVHADPFFFTQCTLIAEQANISRVPAIYPWREYVEAGGLMSYGPNLKKKYRQIGLYAAMMLAGAKAHHLPILRPTRFELVINLKTANALNIKIPPKLLARADDLIQ
jgi:putative ABC transport system substrate-binding protein